MRPIHSPFFYKQLANELAERTELVFLDANAVSYLFAFNQIEQVSVNQTRARLLDSVRDGRRRVVATALLFRELSPIARRSWEEWERHRNLLLTASRGEVIASWEERLEWELRNGARLPRVRALEAGDPTRLFDRSVVLAEARAVTEEKEQWQRKEERLRAAGISELVRLHVEQIGPLPRSFNEAKFVGDVARATSFARQMQERIEESFHDFARGDKLGAHPDLWPEPKRVPTLYYATAYLVGRITTAFSKLQKQGGKIFPKFDAGDLYDSFHFIDAAYVDVFVTEDARFTELIAALEVKAPRVVRFRDWAAELEAESHLE